MRVLLAFDKFKDSLSAREACAIAARTLGAQHPDWAFDLCPLTDGGEGFAEILTQAAGGQTVPSTVAGPRGERLAASFGLVPLKNIPAAARALLGLASAPDSGDASVAVIEMAVASGLALLPPEKRDPWHTTTLGTGQLIRAACEMKVTAILLGVGGSATNDLGLGAVNALGLNFFGRDGGKIQPPFPARWAEIARLGGSIPQSNPPIRIACDVANPLLGTRGAAAIYGPQKGLRAQDHAQLEHESARLALMLCAHCGQSDRLMDVPGTGAAGGLSFGLMVAAGAQLLPGSDLMARWFEFDARIAAADLVITGEGRFDESSLSGKGPGAIATQALTLQKPVHVFAGHVSAASTPGLTLHAITPAGQPLPEALRAASGNLTAALQRIFR